MPKDYGEELESYLKAANDGHAAAQARLGLMYGLGLGVAQDYARAIGWYRRAAEAGELSAQVNLGWMYGTGRGVPQDFVRAYAWYSIAAAGGEETGRNNRDALAGVMTPGQLEQAQELSRELFAKHGAGAKG